MTRTASDQKKKYSGVAGMVGMFTLLGMLASDTLVPCLTSPDSQPHYFISPRHRPHDVITHHITARGVTTAERLKAD